MNIKESFHNKLNQIREGVEQIDEIADTPRGKEAVRQVMHRADATAVDSAINPPRSKKGRREARNAMKAIDRGIAVHKKKGGVLDNYLKRSYGLEEETVNEASDRVVTASKKAEKGTKWRLQARNMDSDGSEMELRQGKRVKLRGAFDRHAQDFNMSPTKKGKIDWKAKSKYYDDPKDILKTVKESEQIDEISSKLASSYLRGNHKSVTDKKGIKIWKAFKRADGRELAVDKLSGTAKVPTKD